MQFTMHRRPPVKGVKATIKDVKVVFRVKYLGQTLDVCVHSVFVFFGSRLHRERVVRRNRLFHLNSSKFNNIIMFEACVRFLSIGNQLIDDSLMESGLDSTLQYQWITSVTSI